jgi:hypothetical protein
MIWQEPGAGYIDDFSAQEQAKPWRQARHDERVMKTALAGSSRGIEKLG